ncbi:MAG: LolA family protein [Alphaproteobacteria bacterium]
MAALTAGLVAASTGMAPVSASELSAEDKADIARVESYLTNVASLRARFIQISSSGSFAEGTLYLRRPGKLRIDYAPPAKLQIFADGFWLIYVDGELGQANHVPLSATPAQVLVAETVRLSGKVTVTRVERGGGILRIHTVQTEEPDSGSLVLGFSDRPLALRQWTVVDPQGIKTRVSLVNPEFNVSIDYRLFIHDVPEPTEGN